MLVIIQLADPSFMRQLAHSTAHEPTAANPEQGLLVFKVGQNEVEALLQKLAASGVGEFRVLFPTNTMQPKTLQYIVEIGQRGLTTFYRQEHGISEPDQFKATRFGSYHEALQHITDFLNSAHTILSEPAMICIKPASSEETWTIEEILAREG